MAVNDTARLSVVGHSGGELHVHTLHFRYLDGLLSTEQALIDAWQASCRTAYRACFRANDQFPCESYQARQVCGSVPLRAPVDEVEVAPNIAGTKVQSGDIVAPWLGVVTSLRTDLGGRTRRGRAYMGGLQEPDVIQDTIQAGQITVVQAYWTAMLSTFGSTGSSVLFRFVIHSRHLAAIPGQQCQDASRIVTQAVVRTFLATTKSRKAGHGI